MSWIRSSKGITLLAVLALTIASVGTVAAVTVDTDAPAEAQVGDTVSVTTTISDVYEDSDDWRLNATTQLEDVAGWEVTKVTPSGEEETMEFDGNGIGVSVEANENIDHINVTVTGTVPTVESYAFEPRQTFDGLVLTRIDGNRAHDIETISVHHYTTASHEARDLIEEAQTAVNGSNSDEAQSRLDAAISAFNGGHPDDNFDSAKTSSEDAIDTAESAESSQQTMQLVLYAVGAIVVIALIAGGVYYYRSQQDEYDKLR